MRSSEGTGPQGRRQRTRRTEGRAHWGEVERPVRGPTGGGSAELAVFAAAAVVGAVGGGGIAFGLAGDAGADAGEGLAAAFGDGLPAFVAMGGGFAGGEMGAGAGDGILDGVVDLVGDGAVGGPAGCHVNAPEAQDSPIILPNSHRQRIK